MRKFQRVNKSTLSQKVRGAVFTATDYFNGIRVPLEDCLVINGFWRSGTTWLQATMAEMLEAKSVFEPFNLPSKNILKCLPEIRPLRQDFQFVNALMPYIPDHLKQGTELHNVVQQALKGQLRGRSWQPRVMSECMRSRTVTKFTRGSLCLRAIANTFQVPIVHIMRDPRAVIASIKTLENGRWAEGTFNNFSLRALLFDVDDGRQEYFQQWESDIIDLEKTNDYGRLTGYYCLTERYLEESFQSFTGKFTVVRYEDLVSGGSAAIFDLVRGFNLHPSNTGIDTDRPSATDWGKQYLNKHLNKKVTQADRLIGWKKQINEHERGIIEEVVTSFNMTDRFWEY